MIMPGIGYTDKFRRLGREYLLQTSINELHRTIVSSLFHSGQLINNLAYPLPDSLNGNALLDYVLRIHKQSLADIDSLLGLVERMRDINKPEIIEKLGKTLCARELLDEGLNLLVLAVQKYPILPGLHNVLGRLYLEKGMHAQAEEELSRAVELAPEFPDYRLLLGIAYLKSNKAVAAISELRKAVEMNVYYDEAYYNLGLAFILNGIVKEDFNLAKNLLHNSVEAFQKATMFNPGFLNKQYEQGLAALNDGRLEQAFELLSRAAEEAVSHHSEERLLEMYLRYVHGENGLTEDGIREYVERIEELLRANPGHADLHNELGMAYTIMSKFMNDRAIEHFKEALKINPNFMKASKNLKLSQNDLKGFEILLEAIVK
jgi:tetratricopeptide (TPR) repeat protein